MEETTTKGKQEGESRSTMPLSEVEQAEQDVILQLACEFRLRHQSEPWSDRRQETLERLLNAVRKKKKKEQQEAEQQERHKFETKERVLLDQVQKVLEKEKRDREEIAKFFKGTVQEIAKSTRFGSLAMRGLRGEEIVRKVAELPEFNPNTKTFPRTKEEARQQAHELQKKMLEEEQQRKTLARIHEFSKKYRDPFKQKAEEKRQQDERRKRTRTKTKIKFHNSKRKRDIVREKFLSSITTKANKSAKGSGVEREEDGGSKQPRRVDHSRKSNQQNHQGLDDTSAKQATKGRSQGSVVTGDAAMRFTKNQRCLFNAVQLDAAEKLYKHLVKDVDGKKKRTEHEPSAGQQAGTNTSASYDEGVSGVSGSEGNEPGEQGAEGHDGKAARLALQQKGFVSRKVMTLSQFLRVMKRSFKSEEDVPLIKRIYSVMCGRDTASKREGLTFTKFSTYVSIMLLGSTAHKMFLFFDILDTDRDGFLTRHDIFTLLRSDAASALSEDFSVLLEWILKVNEKRIQREKKWERRMAKKHKLIRRALRLREDEQQKARQEAERLEREQRQECGGHHEIDKRDSIDDGEEDHVRSMRKCDSESEDSSNGSDSDDSLFSLGSASEWVLNDEEKEAEEYNDLVEICEAESRLDFEGFRALWPRKDPPKFFEMFETCFASLVGGKESKKSPPESTSSTKRSKMMESKKKTSDPFAQSLMLTKAKHGILNTLQNRTKRKMERASILRSAPKSAAAADKVGNPTETQDTEQSQQEPTSQLASGDGVEPGGFLRDLGMSVEQSKGLKQWYQVMRPDKSRGTVKKKDFCKVLIERNVGFEEKPSHKLLCERIFDAACAEGKTELHFSDFLRLFATALHGSRRDQARMMFNILSGGGVDEVYANDLVVVVDSGLDEIDPLFVGFLMDIIIDKVTRSQIGSLTREDMILIGEYIRNEKDGHMRIKQLESEQERMVMQATASFSPQVPTGSAPSSTSQQRPHTRGRRMKRRPVSQGSEEDRRSVGSYGSLASRRTKRRDKEEDRESVFSGNSVSQETDLASIQGETVFQAVREKILADKIQAFELPSVKKKERFIEEYAAVEFVLLYKIVEAFSMPCNDLKDTATSSKTKP